VDLDQNQQSFIAFVRQDGERLRRVMADAALAWAWEHWDRVSEMANPTGYLYRVGQTHAKRALRNGRPITFPREVESAEGASRTDLDLAEALRRLPERQRMAVVLVHAYGWTAVEVGDLTGSPATTVRSHLRRGLRQLRKSLKKGNI
jgi:RNA polymerase sigma factor (sigma-70 family)